MERSTDHALPRAPLLTVYGGKLTTFRVLAKQVVDMLGSALPGLPKSSTDRLPYAAFDPDGFEEWRDDLYKRLSFLPDKLLARWVQSYGRRVDWFTQHLETQEQLGEEFGGGLTECEAHYLIDHEWAKTPDDILFRRTKCGLHMSSAEIARFAIWMDGL